MWSSGTDGSLGLPCPSVDSTCIETRYVNVWPPLLVGLTLVQFSGRGKLVPRSVVWFALIRTPLPLIHGNCWKRHANYVAAETGAACGREEGPDDTCAGVGLPQLDLEEDREGRLATDGRLFFTNNEYGSEKQPDCLLLGVRALR